MQRIFLITGTRKGIGKELALFYLSNGGVVYGCSRGESSIHHDNYHHYSLSVDDEDRVIEMVRSIRSNHGRIDVLVNNAGIASMNHLTLTPYSVVKNIYGTNLFGSFLFLREVAKVMIRSYNKDSSFYGRIVNFSTVATPLSLDGECVYASSKAAINTLTRIAAKELAPFNITVNAIGPTPVETDLIRSVPKAKKDALLALQSIARFGETRDIVNCIEFFVRRESDFVTGQIIYLGGIMGG